MPKTSHKEKLLAAIENPKCSDDITILREAYTAYEKWISKTISLRLSKKNRVIEMTRLLNEYKDYLEVELIAKRGTEFLKRQKGQLKLDNSVLEEFLIHLVNPNILDNLPHFDLEIGPQTAFMSLSFTPSSLKSLDSKPEIALKLKDQDFTIGKTIHYKFSSDREFEKTKTSEGSFYLAVLAAECKVNLDKTMFQESAGTAARLKQGCPVSKYFILVEFLDMTPEDCRLTEIDNVYLLRRARRLPFEKRAIFEEVKNQHRQFPIDSEIVWKFVQEIQKFIDAIWYDPDAALKRGSFI